MSSVQTSVAPGVTATTALEAAPEASAPFKTFVANAKITGVFQGTPARMHINGRLVQEGDIVDQGLGIAFSSIDAARNLAYFKDASGATVARKY